LILRIAVPKGNATKGRLAHAEDLRKKLRCQIRIIQHEQISDIMGRKEQLKSAKKGKLPLAPYATDGFFFIRMTHNGKNYMAAVRTNGLIRLHNVLYKSPTAAAMAITKKPTNGWYVWHYKNAEGKWIRLRKLRKSK
ncbi:MAG: hypothetical protein V1918_07655, partial [Planctomycetota bacterium]